MEATDSADLASRPKRLLLVEDEEHLAFSLKFNLEEEGYFVHLAVTLAEAGLVDCSEIDLILLDVMLPDGSGFDFCQALRDAGDFTPVLMLTAKGTSADIVSGLGAGADDYLTKPFALAELLGRIRAILRRRQWEKDKDAAKPGLSEETFGRNRINFDTHEVVVGDTAVELTDLELRLLRFFLERPNLVVSRQDLLRDVWNLSPNTNTRTVDNFLVRLRRIFELDPAEPQHFLTIRGVGYRFVPCRLFCCLSHSAPHFFLSI